MQTKDKRYREQRTSKSSDWDISVLSELLDRDS